MAPVSRTGQYRPGAATDTDHRSARRGHPKRRSTSGPGGPTRRRWSGEMPLYPNEMVPLQIDRAIGARRYLPVRRADPSPARFRAGIHGRRHVGGREPPGRQVTARSSVPVMSASVARSWSWKAGSCTAGAGGWAVGGTSSVPVTAAAVSSLVASQTWVSWPRARSSVACGAAHAGRDPAGVDDVAAHVGPVAGDGGGEGGDEELAVAVGLGAVPCGGVASRGRRGRLGRRCACRCSGRSSRAGRLISAVRR